MDEQTTAASGARTAVVTGGGRGIGRAIVHALTADGFDVVASARTGEELDKTAASAPGPGTVHAVVADLADEQACLDLAARATDVAGGAVAVLVHNAGISRPSELASTSTDSWHRHLAVNVTAPFLLSRALVPPMAEAGWGRVVSIGSLYSRYGVPGAGPYTTSKHAILGLTRVIAAEFAGRGVTANVLAPGYVDTEIVREHVEQAAAGRGLDEEETLRRILRRQPIRRLIEPAEVAALVSYLCSDAAAPVNGQTINIDGGTYQG